MELMEAQDERFNPRARKERDVSTVFQKAFLHRFQSTRP